jgi:hypothetical protein
LEDELLTKLPVYKNNHKTPKLRPLTRTLILETTRKRIRRHQGAENYPYALLAAAEEVWADWLVFAADDETNGEELVSFPAGEAAAFATGNTLAALEPFTEPEPFALEDAELFETEEAAIELDPVAVEEAAACTTGDTFTELDPFTEPEPFTFEDAELSEAEEAAIELDPVAVEEAAACTMGDTLAEWLDPFALEDAELFEVEEAAVEEDSITVEEAATAAVEFEAAELEEAAPLSETVN